MTARSHIVTLRQTRQSIVDFIARRSIHSKLATARRGMIIYGCGSTPGSVHLIREGKIKLIMPTEKGKCCLLDIRSSGEIFGELTVASSTHGHMAIAMRKTSYHRIPAAHLLDELARENLLQSFAQYLAAQLMEQEQLIAEFVTTCSEERLASLLVRLARRNDAGDRSQLRLEDRITCQDLAQMVGTTRSRVGYFLKKFRSLKLITPGSDWFLTVDARRMERYITDHFDAG